MPSVSTEIANAIANVMSVKTSFNTKQKARETLEKEIAHERDTKHADIDSSLAGDKRKEAYAEVTKELSEKRLDSAKMKTEVNVLSAKYCGARRELQLLLKEAGISIQDDLLRD